MKIKVSAIAALLAFAIATPSLHAANGTWTNKLGGTWSTAVNWSNSVIANAADFTADFSALPPAIVNMSVTNDAARTLGNLKFGAVTNWSLVGSTITLSTNSGIPNINVFNNTARVGVPLSSSQQVLLSGANLALTNDLNTLTGGVVIQCGQFGFTSQQAIGSGVIQLGNGPGGNVAGPGQIGFNAISSATAGTVPVTLANDVVVRTTRWIAGQSGVGLNAQPIIINGNVSLDMGTNGVRDFALQQPLTINGVLSSVSGGNYGVTLGALAGGPLTLANSGNSFVGNITFGVANTVGINSDGALGYFLNRLVFTAAGTLRADAPLTISATRDPITMTATATFNCLADMQIDPRLVGAGGLVKNGTSKLTLTSGFNTFSGAVTINAGTLDLEGNFASTVPSVTINNAGLTNASTFLLGASASAPNISVTVNNGCTFDATAPGGYEFVAGKTLSVPAGGLVRATAGTITLDSGATLIAGSGTTSTTNAPVDASVVASSGSTMIPGTQGTAGTISISNALTLNGHSIQFDLRNNTTEGSGTNDEIIVGGALTLNGGEKIVLNYMDGALAAGTYTLMRCASQSGSFSLAATYPNVTLNQSGTVVSLTVSAPSIANNLFWKGDGAGNVWDVNTTANWVTNFANAALNYTDPSKVTFDDFGSNNVPVTLNGTVFPNAVTFNVTNKAYALTGSGAIAGPVGVTINGGNAVTNGLANTYAGDTVINGASKLVLLDGSTLGSASSRVQLNAATGQVIAKNSSSLSLPNRIFGNAVNPTFVQSGSGTTTLANTADNSGLVALVNAGTLQLGAASSGSIHALGGSSTINSGATLQLTGSGGDQILNGVSVTNLGGTFDTGGNNEQITSLNGYGSVISGGTLTLSGLINLSLSGTLAVTNTTIAFPAANTAWLDNPGSVIFEGGAVTLPTTMFTGNGASGSQNILFDGTVTTGGNGETIFGERSCSQVVTFGPNANATFWFLSYASILPTTFWYNGGTVTVQHFNYRGNNTGSTSSHYFNGSTIRARLSIADFMQAKTGPLVNFYVSTNGLILDDLGFNLSIIQPLKHDPALGAALDGGLTKNGSGTLTLSATNTFNGSLNINVGTLILNNAGSYNNVIVGDNATSQINIAQAGTSLTNSTLTLGTTGGGTQSLKFNFGTLGNPTVPVVQVNGVVTNNGPVVITLIAPFLTPGTVPLIKYGSMDAANFASTWTIAAFPYVDLTLTNDTVNKLISVIVVPGVTPKWKGNLSTAWDTTTLNWTSNGIPANYVETAPPGQPVTFDNTASSFLVDITTAIVSPAFISMSNSTGYTVSGTLGIGGTGALIKNGSGSLVLSNASSANTYSGITLYGGGSLVAAVPNVLSANSAMTFNNSTLDVGTNVQNISSATFNNAVLSGSATLTGGAATTLTFNNSANFALGTPLAGGFAIVQSGAGEMTLTNVNNFTREVAVNSGTLRVKNGAALGTGGFTGSTGTGVSAGGRLILDGTFTLAESLSLNGNGPDGSGALVVTNGAVTLAAPNNCSINTDSGIYIANGAALTNTGSFFSGGTLTKAGPGLLYCAGAVSLNSVIMNQGTTIAAASIGGASGAVIVNNGAAFGGAGTVGASTTIKAGGNLQPGNLGIGTMTINNNLTNAGAILLEISKNGVTLTSDQINVNSNFVHTGTLTATNVGPTALVAGDSFRLFGTNYAAIASAPITLPALASGLGWTNRLFLDGTIAVIATVSTTPFPIGSVVNGGNLELTWPADHTGWRLQVQTNSLSVGLSPTWVDVTGSTLVNSVTNTIDSANGSVFYRMVYP